MDTEALALAIDRAIGAELLAQRHRNKLTRLELRELSGVAEKTIQRFEDGQRSPDVQQLVKLASALNLSVLDFVKLALRDIEGVDPQQEESKPTSQPG
ncbi:helix-turn-helix domain-containing protein [Nocardia sp. NPDC049149]|uniref:helix-turn-helix domain-containing protein n=1 Tax=Nocardia sp. NPDC049149 TaxID=3364315 RepID=UPI00371881A8